MKNRYFLCTALLLLYYGSHILHAQLPYNKWPEYLKANSIWKFGNSKGLDFNSGTAKPDTSAMTSNAAASVCSPVTGEILFYTNGIYVWNKNHQVMPNGDQLLGAGEMQDVCIVPFIDNPNKYYIFQVYNFYFMAMGGPSQLPARGALFYSIVDMSLNNGLGDVIPSSLNTVLNSNDPDSLSIGIIAIPGENCDIWLMTHAFGKPKFKAYHITKNGIEKTPVESIAGNLNLTGVNLCNPFWCYISGSYVFCNMIVSPDRKRIVVSSVDLAAAVFGQTHPMMNGTIICKFDAATGKVSDGVPIGDHIKVLGEPAFSPDNSKLYLERDVFTDEMWPDGYSFKDFAQIVQYDISQHDSLKIAQSEVILADSMFTIYGNLVSYGTFKLYKDTIYVRPQGYAITTINNPNLSGKSCNFQLGVEVEDFTPALHSEVVYNWPDTTRKLILDTSFCTSFPESVLLRPAVNISGYTYNWNNSSSDSILKIQKEGTYWVKYTDGCHYKTDTFRLLLHKTEQPVITINYQELSTSATYKQYQWQLNNQPIPGANQKTYHVLKNGNYRVLVTDENGCTNLSDEYQVTNVTDIDDLDQLGAYTTIFPNPTKDIIYIQAPNNSYLRLINPDGRVLMKQENQGQLSINHLPPGIYFLNIYDRHQRLIKGIKVLKK